MRKNLVFLLLLSSLAAAIVCGGCISNNSGGSEKLSSVSYNATYGTSVGTFEVVSDLPIAGTSQNHTWHFSFGASGFAEKDTPVRYAYSVDAVVDNLSEVNISVTSVAPTNSTFANVSAHAKNLKIIKGNDGNWYLDGDHEGFSGVSIGGSGITDRTMFNRGDWDKTPYKINPDLQSGGLIVLEGYVQSK